MIRQFRNLQWTVTAFLYLSLLAGCASLPENFERVEGLPLDASDTELARTFAAHASAHPDQSGAYPLANGIEALAARVVLVRKAEKTLDVQYYIWHGDESGRLLLKELLDAADRGVRVRLLVDDLGVGAADDGTFRWLDAHPQVSVSLFNPIAARESRTMGLLADPMRLNRRMHNKSMTADSTVTVVGGRNVGDEYFSLNELLNFADMDVLAIGPVASQVSESFNIFWNSPSAIPISAFYQETISPEQLADARKQLDTAVASSGGPLYEAMINSPLSLELQAQKLKFYIGRITVVHDSPDKVSGNSRSEVLLSQLRGMLAPLESDLLIISPYFVPGKEGTEALVALSRRGVKVQVVTNSLAATDVAAVHAGYKKSRRDLLEGGVALSEMMPNPQLAAQPDAETDQKFSFSGSSSASLHAKMFILDREKVFIGSMNLDPRSVEINTEIGLLIESPDLARDLSSRYGQGLAAACYSVVLEPKNPQQPNGAQRLVWIETRDGETIRHDQEPETTFWERMGVGFIGLLPVDSQL